MLSTLKQPKWIILSIVLIFAIYAFIYLSEWQFNRYEQRTTQNKEISLALSKQSISVSKTSDLDNLLEWQSVQLTGKIDTENIRFVRNRYLDSSLGFWVIAPLNLDEKQMILINLGFLPVNYQNRFNDLSFSNQTVNFKGWIRKMETHKITPSDYPQYQIASISAKNFVGNIYENSYIQINDSSVNFKDISFLSEPKLSSGPHFSYAIQWIIFAILLPIGWIILYRSEKN